MKVIKVDHVGDFKVETTQRYSGTTYTVMLYYKEQWLTVTDISDKTNALRKHNITLERLNKVGNS